MDGRVAQSDRTIYSVQMLRAFAAASVAFAHIVSDAGLGMNVPLDAFGVDIFFVISGFIVSYVARADPSHFMLRRLIRIVPFYWAATLALFVIASLAPGLVRSADASWSALLHSLFFVPQYNAGGLRPLLLLGWTLNFEMYFYVVLAVALKLHPRYAGWLCSAAIVATLGGIGWIAPDTAFAAYYGNPIVLEFVLGIAVFHLTRDTRWLGESGLVRPALWLAAAASLALMVFNVSPEPGYLSGVIGDGLPSAVLVFSLVVLEQRFGPSGVARRSFLLGESSYILYLVHPYIVFGILRLVIPDARTWTDLQQWLTALALLGLATALAVAIHCVLERPVLRWLKARLLGGKQAVIVPLAERLVPASAAGQRRD